MLHHQGTHLIQQQHTSFPSLLFAADILEEDLPVVFDIPCQISFQAGLSLPCYIPAGSDVIPVFVPSSLFLLLHSTDLSLPCEFC